jgi:hypothetical protein
MIIMIIVLVVLGFCLYLVETYVPMSPPFIMIIRLLVILFSLLWILSAFGIIDTPMRLR